MYITRKQLRERQLAKRFDVALSFVVKLLKQYRTTGEIAAKPFNGGIKPKLNSDDLAVLAELIEKNNDATLDELCQMLAKKLNINVSRATMGRSYCRGSSLVEPPSFLTDKYQNLTFSLQIWQQKQDASFVSLHYIQQLKMQH